MTATTRDISALYASLAEALNPLVTDKLITPETLQHALDDLVSRVLGGDESYAATTATALAGKQPLDGTLTALAALTLAANKMIYATGADAVATTDLTAFARTLLAAADAAAVRTLLALGSAALLSAGASAGNVPVLDASGKLATAVLPEAVLGAMSYKGAWNASANSPTIPAASSANKGWYYVVSTAGTTTVDGKSEWAVGDWIVSNGTTWDKIDSSDQVNSVAGLTGTITAANLKTALAIAMSDVSGLTAALAAKPDAKLFKSSQSVTFDGSGLSPGIAHGLGQTPVFALAFPYGDTLSRVVTYYKDETNLQFKQYSSAGAASSGTVTLQIIAFY